MFGPTRRAWPVCNGNSAMKLSAELGFILAALSAVGLLFLLEWLKVRPLGASSKDPSGWLLLRLLVLAAVIVLGSLVLLLTGVIH
jgi:hypothetical protein